MHYVMSDVHGALDQFYEMLDRIAFAEKDTLYILGDVIDRGPNSIALLQHIMILPNVQLLRGNHEQMLIDAFRYNNRAMYRLLFSNGGEKTCRDFEALSEKERNEILLYLLRAPYSKELTIDNQEYHLVHGSYADPTEFPAKRQKQALWGRQKTTAAIPENLIVIFGHTPTSYYQNDDPLSIFIQKQIVGIDCGLTVVEGGRLACYCLETKVAEYV